MDDTLLIFVNHWILFPIAVLLRVVFCVLLVTILRRIFMWIRGQKLKQVAVVVLGDIGRSPRMQYHSLSLARHGFKVHLIGYHGSEPHSSISNSENIEICHVHEVVIAGVPTIVGYFLKVISQSALLTWTLIFRVDATEYILLQNPPCIPSLAVCWMTSIFNGSSLIIDWHNYGYSILALALGKHHILVKIGKWYEEIFGQLSCGNLCVTSALEQNLWQNWKISAEVMHDRPGPLFKPIDGLQTHELFDRLSKEYKEFQPYKLHSDDDTICTRFTRLKTNGIVERVKSRPAIVVSSTSWTEDEDFSILIEALQMYEERKCDGGLDHLPDILCIVTGKGPMKSYYQEQLASKEWNHVEVITPWLEADDYPKLLASADLGVSLHTSSSGLDLPMKVVDMFGSGLPVLAIRFSCLHELVRDGYNGLVFTDAAHFCHQLMRVFHDFHGGQELLSHLRANVQHFREITWDDSWDKIVLPLFNRLKG